MQTTGIRAAAALILATTLTPTVGAQTVLFQHLASEAGGGTGNVVAAGDLDGDLELDVLVGSPNAGVGGELHARSGVDASTIFQLSGSTAGERFGTSAAVADDITGDGVVDIVTGAPGDGTMPGRVYAHDGATGALLWTAVGASNGDDFGAALSITHDHDGDGLDDVLVGAPGDDAGGTNAGRAVLLSSADGGELASHPGDDPGDELGSSVSSSLPDDLWAGHDPDPTVGATQGGGTGEGYSLVLSTQDFSVLHRHDGVSAGDHFGARVTHVGDLDGDDISELAVTAVQQPAGTGYVHVYSGADDSLLFGLTGVTSGADFGRSVAGVGDVDGDGTHDIVVGEPAADGNGADCGAVHVFSGADGTLLHTVLGPAGSRFGAHVALLGDIDDDDLADFAVGAPADDTGATDAGAVTALSFSPWDSDDNGVAGTYGIPKIVGRGGLLPGTDVTITLSGALENATVQLAIGSVLATDPVHGIIVPVPEAVEVLTTNANGAASFTYTWPTGMPSGTEVYYQARVADSGGSSGEALSNTILGTAP